MSTSLLRVDTILFSTYAALMARTICTVSAIVTNYNGWSLGLLNDFFTELFNLDFMDFEIFLVDNASTDESVEQVRKRFGSDLRLRIIENPVNNMSLGISQAIEKASGKFVLFLNNDIYFAKGAIKTMVDYLEQHPQVASVQGKIVSYYDHQKLDDVGETMDLFGNPQTLGSLEEDKGQYDQQVEILSATGAASLSNLELVRRVGSVDPNYEIGYEDMDLSLRLRIAGYTIYYLPNVLVFHRRGASVSKSDDRVRARIKFTFNRNRLVTIIKGYQPSKLLIALPIVVGLYLVGGLVEIIYKRLVRFGISRYLALAWVILHLPALLIQRSKVQRFRVLNDDQALTPFMSKSRILGGLKFFIRSKRW